MVIRKYCLAGYVAGVPSSQEALPDNSMELCTLRLPPPVVVIVFPVAREESIPNASAAACEFAKSLSGIVNWNVS